MKENRTENFADFCSIVSRYAVPGAPGAGFHVIVRPTFAYLCEKGTGRFPQLDAWEAALRPSTRVSVPVMVEGIQAVRSARSAHGGREGQRSQEPRLLLS